jgi:hypothetical protein
MNENTRQLNCEIVEITPVVLGGSPIDPKNKSILTREQHFEYVRYWNKIIFDLKKKNNKA